MFNIMLDVEMERKEVDSTDPWSDTVATGKVAIGLEADCVCCGHDDGPISYKEVANGLEEAVITAGVLAARALAAHIDRGGEI